MLYFIGVPVLVITCLVVIWWQEVKDFIEELFEDFE